MEAKQWLPVNKNEVLDWLGDYGIQYSFHDIASAGELIVYRNGPTQVSFGYWIILEGMGIINICDDEIFKAMYEEING